MDELCPEKNHAFRVTSSENGYAVWQCTNCGQQIVSWS